MPAFAVRAFSTAGLAKHSPRMGFTSLAYLINMEWLGEAYRPARKDGAMGVDGQTAEMCVVNLEGNLQSLLDLWFEREVKRRRRGPAFLIRDADDAVMGFAREEDAQRVLEALPKRLGRFRLTFRPPQTRLLRFCAPSRKDWTTGSNTRRRRNSGSNACPLTPRKSRLAMARFQSAPPQSEQVCTGIEAAARYSRNHGSCSKDGVLFLAGPADSGIMALIVKSRQWYGIRRKEERNCW